MMQQQQPTGYNNPYPPPPGGGYQPFNHGQGFGIPTDVPGAGSAQICGIIGLILFFNIVGIVLNIVAIVQGAKAMTEYTNNPGRYTEASFRKAKSGKTCGIVGLCLFGFGIIVFVMFMLAFASSF